MSKYDLKDITDIEAEKAFFSEVIIRGFRYLHENFHINILTPYLEFANSYYLQTYFTEKLLQLNYTELSYHYNNLYHRSKQKQPYQIFTNLLELSNAGILENRDDIFIGSEDIYSTFSDQMPFSY